MKKHISNFTDNGYIIFPSIVPKKSIFKLVNECDSLFKKDNTKTLKPQSFLKSSVLINTLLSEPVLNVLKDLLNTHPVFYPNFTIRKNPNSPWHFDDAFVQEDMEWNSLSNEFLQCSIYLQDSRETEGGGLEVVPKSHHDDYFGSSSSMHKLLKKSKSAVQQKIALPTMAGDLLIWNARLMHRSMPVKITSNNRYAIQWTVSKSTKWSMSFLQHLKSRGDSYDGTDNRIHDARYKNIASIQYPSSFPECFISLLENHGCTIKTF